MTLGRRKLLLLGPLALLGLAVGCRPRAEAAPPREKLSLRLRGVDGSADLARIAAERVTVEDPHEHRALELVGVPVTRVFDAAFGPSWRTLDDVVATCADGFHPSMPVRLFLDHEGYLAYARTDGNDFYVDEKGKHTPAGPYYLVWKRTPGDAPPEPAWPYQVTGLEITDFATRMAAALPPAGASPLAREGFERFRTYCLPCHSVNGAGGQVGPELNYPTSVTEYFAEPVLRAWITDPAQVRWNARMPVPLPAEARAQNLDAILAYLQAMAGAKRAPAP
jgi:mono/diheme cytochrome c family protein